VTGKTTVTLTITVTTVTLTVMTQSPPARAGRHPFARTLTGLKQTALAAALALASAWALALEPFIITDIRVEGLERLEAGTVFNYLPLKVGDELTDEEARLGIKELFATGFFREVELTQDGTVLVVTVVERPSISEITITGNRALDTEVLTRGMEEAGLVEGRIFNAANLERVKQEIANTYLSAGRYSATVESTVEEQERNRVAITLDINEGRVATIKKINIIGAESVDPKTLKKEMSLRDKRGLNPFSRRNQYSKQKLEADLESIRSYYLDRGFHDFEIVSRSVEISPNKQNIFISINIDEGAQYIFGDTVFEIAEGEAGDAKYDLDALADLVSIQRGSPFSRKTVNESRAAIAAHFADAGYAFVEVRPISDSESENGVVKTVFAIEPKQRVYVRRIDITGNVNTRDQVIRRELRQFEGAWYSAAAIKRSRERLRRLGYFGDVTIDTPPVAGATDQVDMVVTVSETSTGSVSFSVGYSDADGTIFGVEYSQRNLLGTGRELRVKFDTNQDADSVEIAYINPYHTPDGVSRELILTSQEIDTSKSEVVKYEVDASGAGVRYKIPISETNHLNLGFELEDLTLKEVSETPDEIKLVIDEKPSGYNLVSTVGVSRDSRDDFFFPTRGLQRSMSLEMAVPGSEYEYYKFNFHNAVYIPLSESLTAKASLTLGFGGGYGDSNEELTRTTGTGDAAVTTTYRDGLPFFKHYLSGDSVRGYKAGTLGPLLADSNNVLKPIGGDKRLLLGAELLFPPFGGEAGADKRFGLFVDGGMVFGQGETRDCTGTGAARVCKKFPESIDLSELRYSAGLSFNWVSPIGPFTMSYSETLNDESGDKTDSFDITVGSVF